jgi:hypothetical protein
VLGVIGFMNAALGARFVAAGDLAAEDVAFLVTGFGATFLLAIFFAVTFLAVAIRHSPGQWFGGWMITMEPPGRQLCGC